MAWETRKRGGRYYYRSIRVNGEVKKQYFGRGPAAEQAAREDAAAKKEREAACSEQRKLDHATEPFFNFIRQSDVLIEATLLAAGCYKHKGQWRKSKRRSEMILEKEKHECSKQQQRVMSGSDSKLEEELFSFGPTDSSTIAGPSKISLEEPTARLSGGDMAEQDEPVAVQRAEQITMQEFQRIAAKANKGDQRSLDEMKRQLDLNPSIWEQIGDLGAHAELSLVDLLAEGSVLVAESFKRHIASMKMDLAGSFPTPPERLAIQRVVACWLHCQLADKSCTAAAASSNSDHSWIRRQETAEKKFQIALKSLKLVRELMPPPAMGNLVATDPADADNGNSPVEKDIATETTATGAANSGIQEACKAVSEPGNYSNGHVRQHTIVPTANGKPVNRVFDETPSTEPAFALG